MCQKIGSVKLNSFWQCQLTICQAKKRSYTWPARHIVSHASQLDVAKFWTQITMVQYCRKEEENPSFVTHFFHSLIILIITDYPDPDKRTSSRIRTKRTSSGIQIHITNPNICKHKYIFTEGLAFNWIPIFKINLHTLRIFFTLPIRCFLLLDFFF